MDWFERELRTRLERYRPQDHEDTLSISLKLRVNSGCFDHRCCPAAWRIIKPLLDDGCRERRERPEFLYEPHESGPEFLLYLACIAGVANLSSSLINLVTAIIKARSEGQKQGDNHADEPLELIIRGINKAGRMFDERVLRITPGDEPTREVIRKAITDAIQKQLSSPTNPPAKKLQPKPAKAQKKSTKRR